MSVSRRELFRTLLPLRRAEAVEPPAVASSGGGAPPVVRLREGLAQVETSRVGSGPASLRAGGAGAGQPLPPGFGVEVQRWRCMALSSFCSVCTERCPVPGALSLVEGFPVVQPSCNGCGQCIRVCPAPINAFQLVPRPTPQSSP